MSRYRAENTITLQIMHHIGVHLRIRHGTAVIITAVAILPMRLRIKTHRLLIPCIAVQQFIISETDILIRIPIPSDSQVSITGVHPVAESAVVNNLD